MDASKTTRPAIAYCRVSTIGQAADGVSLEAQRAKAQQYAEVHDLDLKHIFSDTQSGSRADNREGLQAAMKAATRCKGILIVHSLTRFARSTTDAIQLTAQLEKHGCDLVSLTEKIDTASPMGRFVFRLLASLGELEREQVAQRTRDALAHLKRNGKRVGAIPFGYVLDADGTTLRPDEAEQRTLKSIKRLRANGRSYRYIADHLNRRGVPAKNGGHWQTSAVHSILRRLDETA